MDIVRRAADGKIDHDELIQILKTWAYEPQYKTTGLGDDWQSSMWSSSPICRLSC